MSEQSQRRTAADIPALEHGASNINEVADEARNLMKIFDSALAEYGNVFGDYTDRAGGYRGGGGGDLAEIWNENVVPARQYATNVLQGLDEALGDVGTQTRGTARKLSDADDDATSTTA